MQKTANLHSNQLEETARRKTDAEKETAACQESIEILKGELVRTKEEREDLLSNIEAKEGINTAMQQVFSLFLKSILTKYAKKWT